MSKELERQIFINIKRLNSIVVDKYNALFDECSATGVQFCVLRNISHEGSTMTELKQSVSCAASNMTTLIKRMKRDGLVRTDRISKDLRENRVYLTEYGQNILNSMEPLFQVLLSNLFDSLAEEEQRVLNKLLERVISQFD